ncbi:hypothetical protein [Calothrix sp. CCY 0018]|uniref:hypothetical protein n=1 Tax=Calothrix sp. CCY 0018 TaxID=3103864 RepID=UPI0039C72D3C
MTSRCQLNLRFDGREVLKQAAMNRSKEMGITLTDFIASALPHHSLAYPNNDDIVKLLNQYRSCLKETTNNNKNTTLYHLLEKTDNVTNLFDTALNIKLSTASIIFLKLRAELYQHQNLDKTSFNELVANFVEVRERDIALALWLVGVCFGFEFFCANYYEATQPGFFLEF